VAKTILSHNNDDDDDDDGHLFFFSLTNCKGTLTFIITRHSLALVIRSFFEQLGFFRRPSALSLHLQYTSTASTHSSVYYFPLRQVEGTVAYLANGQLSRLPHNWSLFL
jgi:hypothetical protein